MGVISVFWVTNISIYEYWTLIVISFIDFGLAKIEEEY